MGRLSTPSKRFTLLDQGPDISLTIFNITFRNKNKNKEKPVPIGGDIQEREKKKKKKKKLSIKLKKGRKGAEVDNGA